MSFEENCNDSNECSLRFPTFKVSSCPPFPPNSQESGGNCSQCPSAIINIYFDEGTVDINPLFSTTLTLPPITVTEGQRFELNAFATFNYQSKSTGTAFGGELTIILYRDLDILVGSKDGTFAALKATNDSQAVYANPSLTWIDTPPPGNYVYSLLIVADSTNMDDAISFLSGRALTAKLYNAP